MRVVLVLAVWLFLCGACCGYVHDGVKVTSEYLENHPLMRAMAGRTHIPLQPKEVPKSKPIWFTQKLDHFNPLENRTFHQQVVVDDQHYAPGGPIFIFLDGEAPMGFFGFQEVTPYYFAKKFGAMYISIEHRYYGKSLPFASFATPNMRWLSSQQALADTAYFIDTYNKTLTNPGPWVVFGCSYSGALSAWFRAKYPNSVIASVAPSGPVYANINFTQYYGQFETSCNMIGCEYGEDEAVCDLIGSRSKLRGCCFVCCELHCSDADRKSTRLNSSHRNTSRMPSSA